MDNKKEAIKKIPGYPFEVPPPFPGPQLRTLVPAKMPSDGKFEMVKAASIPKMYNDRPPVVCLGCTWDPITRQWIMSDRNHRKNKQLINQHRLVKDSSLLSEYMRKMANFITVEDSLVEEVQRIALEEELNDNTGGTGAYLLLVFKIEPDTAENILMNLDSSSLMNMELTCTALKELICDKNIWQKQSKQKLRSNPDIDVEWGLKFKKNSRLMLKKTLIQFDRIGQNWIEGSGILSEYSQVKVNAGLSMVCNERFLAERQGYDKISVMDGSKRMSFPVDIIDHHTSIVGMTKDTLVIGINLFKITINQQDMLENVSYVTSIRPSKSIMHLSLVGDFLAILTCTPVFAQYVEIYKIVSSQPVFICEVQIPRSQVAILSLAEYPTYFMYWWQSIAIMNGKVFLGLMADIGNVERNKIHVANFKGDHVESIGGMLDGSRELLENVCLKARDGFLYVVTFEKIKIWSEAKGKIVMTKRIDLVNDRLPVIIGLNAKVLIVANQKMMMAWDRKEFESGEEDMKKFETREEVMKEHETGEEDEVEKNNLIDCKFVRQVMSGCDASMLWKVELPYALEKISLGMSKITLIPWYKGDSVMGLDFWK